MSSPADAARRALAELRAPLDQPADGLPEAFLRRSRRAAEFLEKAARPEQDAAQREGHLVNALLQLMRARGAVEGLPHSVHPAAQAVLRALGALKDLAPGRPAGPAATAHPSPDELAPLRRAALKLGPLLRRRGTSPEMGRALRRAVEVLDAALGPHPPMAARQARTAAATAIGEAVALTRRSDSTPADLEVVVPLEQVVAALGARPTAETGPGPVPQPAVGVGGTRPLPIAGEPTGTAPPLPPTLDLPPPAPTVKPPSPAVAPVPHFAAVAGGTRKLEIANAPRFEPAPHTPPLRLPPTMDLPRSVLQPTPAAPLPLAVPLPPSSAVPPRAPAPRIEVTSTKARETFETVSSRLAMLYTRRRYLLDDVGLRWRDLARLDARIAQSTRSAEWLSDVGDEDGAPEHPGEVFAHTLIALARRRGSNRVGAEQLRRQIATDAARTAAWFAPTKRVGDVVDALATAQDYGVRLTVAQLGLAHGLAVAPAHLVALLDAPTDDVAVAACRLLLTVLPSRRTLEVAVDRFRRDPAGRRADGLLLLASGMGAPQALDEVRRRLAAGSEEPLLIQALAIAGGGRDADLLAAVAARGGPAASFAALACGHLGHAPALQRLPDGLDGRIRAQALTLVFGDGEHDFTKHRRMLRGRPWSPESAAEHASDPDEWLVCRSLRAMELAARLGQPCPRCFEVEAPASLQAKGVEALHTATRSSRIPPGDWVFEPRAFT